MSSDIVNTIQNETVHIPKKRGRPRKYTNIEEWRKEHSAQNKKWYEKNKEEYLKILKERRDNGVYNYYHDKNPNSKRNLMNKLKSLENELLQFKECK
jgi:hypothetical protein